MTWVELDGRSLCATQRAIYRFDAGGSRILIDQLAKAEGERGCNEDEQVEGVTQLREPSRLAMMDRTPWPGAELGLNWLLDEEVNLCLGSVWLEGGTGWVVVSIVEAHPRFSVGAQTR